MTVTCMNGKRRKRHTGFSLVELLVAMAVALILVSALARFFKYVGDTVSAGRALLYLTADLHARRVALEHELRSATAFSLAGIDGSSSSGYFEIIEGPLRDGSTLNNPDEQVFGDVDDVLAFTVRSSGQPFRGQLLYFTKMLDPTTVNTAHPKTIYALNVLPGTTAPATYSADTLESDTAEVIYWLTLDDKNQNGRRDYGEYYVLRRRVLLVRPDVVLDGSYGVLSYPYGAPAAPSVFTIADLSMRRELSKWSTNNLENLSRRENRFGRNGTALGVVGPPLVGPGPFPNFMLEPEFLPRLKDVVLPPINGNSYTVFRAEEDIVLSHVVAFDVQVFDPQANMRVINNEVAVAPHDPGYTQAATALTSGAFIDLGRDMNLPAAQRLNTPFSQASWLQQNYANALASRGISTKAIYDSWSLSYDRDGINQLTNPNGPNPDPFIDTGSDGLDNNGNGLTDELAEFEAPPPYAASLRGIKITIRVIDPDTRQVSQTTVIADFTPF